MEWVKAGATQPLQNIMVASTILLQSPAGRIAQRQPVHSASCPVVAMLACRPARSVAPGQRSLVGQSLVQSYRQSSHSQRATSLVVWAVKDGAKLDRPLRVAVVGGGPGGASAADTLAKNGIETYLFERKMDNCKVYPEKHRTRSAAIYL